jgi:ankyrin repeat protein
MRLVDVFHRGLLALALALAATAVAGSAWAQLADVSALGEAMPPDLVERAAAEKLLGKLVAAGDVAGLEATVAEARETGALMPDGQRRVDFYDRTLLGTVPGREEGFESWAADAGRLIEAWKRAHPESPMPWVLQAKLDVRRAWEFRGSGRASDVDSDAWPKFEAHLKEAEKALARAAAMNPPDADVYATWLGVAMGLSYPRERLDELFEFGMGIDPGYLELHRRMAINLLPRWGGRPGDLERFAVELAGRFEGKESDRMYARFTRYDFDYVGAGEFGVSRRYDRDRILRGYRLLQEAYPDIPRFIAEEVEIALAMGLKEEALGALGRLDPVWRPLYFGELSDDRIIEAHGVKETLLRKAARDGDAFTLGQLLQEGVAPDAADKEGFPATAYAIHGGRSDLLESLLLRGADPNYFREGGTSVLGQSVRSENIACVRVLLRHGANPNGTGKGDAPLHTAIWHGYTDIVTLLLEAGADVEGWNDQYDAPLPQAVSLGRVDIARQLLLRGANPNTPWTQGVKDPRKASWTPLHYAVRRDEPEMARLLLSFGADPMRETAELGTPFEYALKQNRGKLIAVFREHVGSAAAEIKMSAALAPVLFSAIDRKDEDGVRDALALGADPNSRNQFGWSPLHAALQVESDLLVIEILEAGGDPNAILDEKWTPISLALSKKLGRGLEALLKHGADPSVRTNDRTPLLHAVEMGNVEWVRLLVEAGADPNETSGPVGDSPLHYAVFHGMREIFAYLVDLPEIDLNVGDVLNRTPLHAAAFAGNAGFAATLIEKGADPLSRESEGKTPLDYARQWKREAMIALYEEKGIAEAAPDEASRLRAERRTRERGVSNR